MRKLILLLGVAVAEFPYQHLTQSWIWGEGFPNILFIDGFSSGSISDKEASVKSYSDHGFIQIHAQSDCLYIDFVKRPPGRIFPLEEKFCSTMLPAAIAEFMDSTFESIQIRWAHVHISSDTYELACKCYVHTFISMGLTRIGERSPISVSHESVNDFCRREEVEIIARPPLEGDIGHIPISVSPMTKEILRKTASTIVIERTLPDLSVEQTFIKN